MRPVIDMQGIHRIFETEAGFTHVLHNICFTVERGEFVAITGPSGSGKSTLMNILGCLDTPTSGTYRLAGLNVAELTDNELAEVRATQIGFVFQSFNLLSRMTVLENVMLPLAYIAHPRADRERRAVAALQAVALPVERYDHRANELSGGQMQRVAIARALVNNPDIILADEPTGNLDSHTGEMVLETFHRLKAAGKTIVLITHDEHVAASADRTVRIVDGRIAPAPDVDRLQPSAVEYAAPSASAIPDPAQPASSPAHATTTAVMAPLPVTRTITYQGGRP